MAKLTFRNVWLANSIHKESFLWDEQVSGFGVRIKPSGVKSFFIQYRNKDKRSRRITIGRFGGITLEQARKVAQEHIKLVELGQDPAEIKSKNSLKNEYLLFSGCFSNYQLIEMILLEGNLKFQIQPLEKIKNYSVLKKFSKLNYREDELLLLNNDGDTMNDIPAIILYLCEFHGLHHLIPEIHEKNRAIFLDSLFAINNFFGSIFNNLPPQHLYCSKIKAKKPIKISMKNDVLLYLEKIEKEHYNTGSSFLNDRFSLIDLILSYWIEFLDIADCLSKMPNLKKCYSNVRTRSKINHVFSRFNVNTCNHLD